MPECQPALRTHLARYRFVESFVQDAVVLDAGCGCGYGSHHLALAGAERVLGIDLSPEAVEYARSHYAAANLDFIVADVTALALLDETFDAVIGLEVLEHVDEQRRLIAEAHRVLKHGGHIVVSTPNGDLFSPKGAPLNPWHVREFSRDEFVDALASYFQDIRLWGQTVKAPGALALTRLHLRMQRYIATRESLFIRAIELGYGQARKALMALTRLVVKAVKNDQVVFAKAGDLPTRSVWYFVGVGCKGSSLDVGQNQLPAL
jgi:2-polyprenyl-3-methyl-5-hydroxy-6-metoxy-1,4-benzoquinol methylase